MVKANLSVPDYYEALRLPFGATTEAVRTSFRRLAKFLHPDIPKTGSEIEFIRIFSAYQVLSSEKRSSYDELYLKLRSFKEALQQTSQDSAVYLPMDRVEYPTNISTLARKGLMRKGLRTKDRRKFTGIHYDILLQIRPEELGKKVVALIPQTVRVVCGECLGRDPHCSACGGAGTYKSSRNLKVEFSAASLQNGRMFSFDLSKFRPDSFTHFKKKILKVKILVQRKTKSVAA